MSETKKDSARDALTEANIHAMNAELSLRTLFP